MVKGGIVVSDHSSQSSRSNSPTSSKTPSEDEWEVPCEGDLLVVRHILGQHQTILMKLRKKTFFIPATLSTTSISLIIDGGSCANVANRSVVEKLGLPTIFYKAL